MAPEATCPARCAGFCPWSSPRTAPERYRHARHAARSRRENQSRATGTLIQVNVSAQGSIYFSQGGAAAPCTNRTLPSRKSESLSKLSSLRRKIVIVLIAIREAVDRQLNRENAAAYAKV